MGMPIQCQTFRMHIARTAIRPAVAGMPARRNFVQVIWWFLLP